jgi:hypothetical protein
MQGRRLQGCLLGCVTLLLVVGCDFPGSHQVTAPERPAGQAFALVGEDVVLSATGSVCTRSHAVLYQWDWGDGKSSDWLPEGPTTHAWESPGRYAVKARARCQQNDTVVSPWSEGLDVLVMLLPIPPLQ